MANTAFLGGANMRGARLSEANMQGVALDLPLLEIGEPEFDTQSRLPDGSEWTPGTKMQRFTDAEHPDFWRSDNPLSPASRERGYAAGPED